MLQSSVRAQTKEVAGSSFTRQGSQRKVVPTDLHKQDILGRKNEEISKFYKQFHQEYSILAEYKMLQSESLKGVYVIPSKESSFLWFGVVFVRTGFYEDGVFRFNIYLSETFPDGEHPKVVFQSEVYHPVINQNTNELHLLDGFPEWKSGEQHIWQILKYIQWIFHSFNASLAHSIDFDIKDLHDNNLDAFKENVERCVKKSIDEIYDPSPVEDQHYIVFERYDSAIHDPVRKSMLEDKSIGGHQSMSKGHSWVAPNSFKPLSRPPTPDPDESES